MENVAIAYEPVWAIGTGLTATPEIAQDVHSNIRAILGEAYGQAVADKVVIQYGGSVTPDTVDELMAMPDIDGVPGGGGIAGRGEVCADY
ncbi:triosephosphate isomerase [Nannochloropsis gaditana]|uniref:Triosephosphate isomerase n=1 Tax=Nannochloropsis gaditana TaxID=72520 RepID=W7T695_9STRA|nr:triosephosphate isomerase [Nannochloropsis gaditana]